MSEKKYPKRVRFFIADDIRVENIAKPMLLGLFPDDIVAIPMPPDAPNPTKGKPIVLQGLAILVSFLDCRGPFVMEASLYLPDGLPILEKKKIEGDFTDPKSPKQGNINFIAKFMPFSIPSFGKYKFVISLDKREYPYEFTFTRQASPTGSKRVTSSRTKKLKK